MDWVEGESLKDYLNHNKSDQSKLKRLADDFYTMCVDLHKANISHGDLQTDNIRIDSNGKIKLIDYDSLYVPALKHIDDLVKGVPHFQHPGRRQIKELNAKSDYFSELIIYLGILAIAEREEFWDEFNLVDPDTFFFTEGDYRDIENSRAYEEFVKLQNPHIQVLLLILVKYCKEDDITKLTPLEQELSAYNKPPKITLFKVDKPKLDNTSNKKVILKWSVEHARKVALIGIEDNLPLIHEYELEIHEDREIELLVENYNEEKDSQTISIEVSKAPPAITISNIVPNPVIEGKKFRLEWAIEGAEKVYFIAGRSKKEVSQLNSLEEYAKLKTTYRLEAISYFGVIHKEDILVSIIPIPRIRNFELPKIPATFPRNHRVKG